MVYGGRGLKLFQPMLELQVIFNISLHPISEPPDDMLGGIVNSDSETPSVCLLVPLKLATFPE